MGQGRVLGVLLQGILGVVQHSMGPGQPQEAMEVQLLLLLAGVGVMVLVLAMQVDRLVLLLLEAVLVLVLLAPLILARVLMELSRRRALLLLEPVEVRWEP